MKDKALNATAGHGGLHHRRACACHCLSSAPPSSTGSTPRHRSFVAGKVMWIKWQVGRTRVYFVAHGWHSPVLAALAAASCGTCRHGAPWSRPPVDGSRRHSHVQRSAGTPASPSTARSTGRPRSRTRPGRCKHRRRPCRLAVAPPSARRREPGLAGLPLRQPPGDATVAGPPGVALGRGGWRCEASPAACDASRDEGRPQPKAAPASGVLPPAGEGGDASPPPHVVAGASHAARAGPGRPPGVLVG